jgi:DNA-binding transcriptional LysR family regulator
VQELTTARRLLELRAGVIDAELLLAPDSDEPGLVMEAVVHSPRHVLLASNHPLAGMKELRFDQIAQETFPGLHESLNARWAKECWLTELRGGDPELTEEKPLTLDELWALIHTGKAVDVLPDFMVAPMVGSGVCAIPLVDVPPFEFSLARRANDTRAVLAALFETARSLDREQTTGAPMALAADQ